MKIFDTCLIIERMKESAGKETDKFLLEIFGIAQNTLSGWKSRNSMPLQAIITFSNKYDVSIDWLITGKSKEQEADPVTAMLLAGFNGLTDLQKLQAITFIGNLANNQQETHSTSSISQSSGENGINNAAGGDINIHKDSNQSVDVEPVKKRKKSTWTFIGNNGDLYD